MRALSASHHRTSADVKVRTVDKKSHSNVKKSNNKTVLESQSTPTKSSQHISIKKHSSSHLSSTPVKTHSSSGAKSDKSVYKTPNKHHSISSEKKSLDQPITDKKEKGTDENRLKKDTTKSLLDVCDDKTNHILKIQNNSDMNKKCENSRVSEGRRWSGDSSKSSESSRKDSDLKRSGDVSSKSSGHSSDKHRSRNHSSSSSGKHRHHDSHRSSSSHNDSHRKSSSSNKHQIDNGKTKVVHRSDSGQGSNNDSVVNKIDTNISIEHTECPISVISGDKPPD